VAKRSEVRLKGVKAWEKRLSAIQKAGSLHVTVGVHGDAERDDGGDALIIAGANEFGTDTIPERSFIRATVDTRRNDIANVVQKVAEKVADERVTPEAGMEIVGQWMQAAIRKRIQSNVPPPNAAITVSRKGSSHTLIDTGQLRQSITYVVDRGPRPESV
jgi:hypothetical protein